MNVSANKMLMTEGSISQKLIRFTVPIFIGNLFQQLYNTADTLIVGRFLGNDALAAVSATGSLVFLMISFFSGIAQGAGVAIARYFGAGDTERLKKAVHTNMCLSLIGCVLLTLLGVFCTEAFLRLMGTPEDILPSSAEYIRIIFAGSTGMVIYNSCCGIMQAVGDSIHPLQYLIISSVTNVILDIAFIVIFHGGVGSAALATIISQCLSAILCLARLMRTKEDHRIRIDALKLDRALAAEIIRYGIPSGLQNSVIAIANVVVQSNINAFGKMAVAGCGAYAKIEGFAFLPINSFTTALTTFVGQNLGAGKYDRAKKGARFGIFCCMGLAEFVGIMIFILAKPLVSAFTQEAEAIAFGVLKMRTTSLFFFLLAASHSLSAVLRGAGRAVIPMISMLSFWCIFRVIFISVMTPIVRSIAVVNWVYPLTWSLSAIFLVIYYIKADWVHSFGRKKA